MSSSPNRGTLRIIGGASSARVLVAGGDGGQVAVPDSHSLLSERARAEGFAAGRAAALAEAAARESELEAALARLESELPVALEAQFARFEETLRGALVDVAFQIAENLVRSSVLSAEAVRSAVDEALSLPLLGERIEVRCHPADVARIGDGGTGRPGRLHFVADPRLEPGDVWIETAETGDLDGRVAGRLGLLRERLEATVESPSAES